MKYKEQQELVEGLRELADFVEGNIELPALDVTATVHVNDYKPGQWTEIPGYARSVLRQAAKALAPCQKKHESYYFAVERKFGSVIVSFISNRKAVCERIVVGQRHVPEQTLPARIEEVVEWVCSDSLLAAEE